MDLIGPGRRRPVDVKALVRQSFLDGRDDALPSVFVSTRADMDLAAWARGHSSEIEAELRRFGAVLFRGFPLRSAAQFEEAAASLAPDLFGDYGDLPREAESDKVYKSTPYPNDLPIHPHNESSHLLRWPRRIFFFCAVPPETGGRTPVVDGRRICQALDSDVLQEFSRKGVMYVRNFSPGLDVAWQEFFATDDRTAVEARCESGGTKCEWRTEGSLRTRFVTAAVRPDPISGEQVFFNQILLHHPAALPAATRSALYEIFDPESLPRNAYFGDGTVIPDAVIDHLLDVYEGEAVRFAWQAGDLLMLDNLRVAHGREAFAGNRKILVAMADLTG